MPRLNLTAALLLLSAAASSAAFAAPPPTQPPNPVPPTVAEPVQRGDAARAARRWSDAADAYKAALETADRERLPLTTSAPIAGELGMCELALGRYRDAAEYLRRALNDEKALTQAQSRRFRKGLYEDAYGKVARLFISINPPDAQLFIDRKRVEAMQLAYELYLEPGDHALRVRLDGYYDEEMQLYLPAGGEATTGITLREVPRQGPPAAPAVLPAQQGTQDTAAKILYLERTMGSVGLLPMISFGLAPSVSAGGALDFTWRWPRLSIGADFRIFASETTDSVSAVRTVMGRSHLSVCGHRSFLSLCGLAGLGRLYAIKDATIKVIETEEPWSGSIGIRPAAEWQFSEHLALRGFGEFHAMMGQANVWVDGQKLWAAPAVAGVLGVGVMVPFGHRRSDENAARMDARRIY